MGVWQFIQDQVFGMKWLNELIGKGLSKLGLDVGERIGGSIQFFFYDVLKITVLLCLLIFVISYIQSYFPPERSKRILSRFHGVGANIISALLGTVTPFCSCSSIPLFIGFTSAGLPLGVTFSFLISSPKVDLGSLNAFLPVAYVYGQDYYIDDCVCDNGLPNIVDALLTEILVRDKVKSCRFESNSAGGRVAEKIQNEVKKRGGITKITTKFTTANKETKIIVNSAWVKERCLFKDSSLYQKKSDYGKMMDMLCSYTMSGKNKHDDVPDGMAMAVIYVALIVKGKRTYQSVPAVIKPQVRELLVDLELEDLIVE